MLVLNDFLKQFLPDQAIPAFGAALGIRPDSSAKVLHLVAGNLYGGIERMLVCMARWKQCFPAMRPTFGICYPGRLKDELASYGSEVPEFGRASFRNPISTFLCRRRLGCFLRRNTFDWVVCHGAWIHALFGGVIRKNKTRFAHMIHGLSNALSWQEKWCQNWQPDLVLANSRATLVTANNIFEKAEAMVAYPPCDPGPVVDREVLRRKWRSLYGATDDQVIVLAASRMESGKGIDILIDALSRLKKIDNWKCWVAGEPQRHSESRYFDALKLAADRSGVGNRIKWLGHIQDMAGHFAAVDVYCQPNRLPESFGMTFVEAQSMGCPVVTTAFGGALETVEGNNANILVNKACPELYAKSLAHIVNCKNANIVKSAQKA